MGSKKTAARYSSILLFMLFSTSASFASDSSLAQIEAKPAERTLLEGCLANAGLGNMQVIKNMTQKFGPEAVLDMMFSSVNPIFQPALLTKSNNDPAKPVKNIEDMREDKYFQHAITSTGIPAPWIKVTADRRVITPQAKTENQPDKSWLRLPFAIPANSRFSQEGKTQEPAATGVMQRY